MNDSFLSRVSDSNLPRNRLPIRIVMINLTASQRCRCAHPRAAMFRIDGGAMISWEQSLTPGLCGLPHCLFPFWAQLWKWKRPSCINFQSSCIIIQLQKGGGKKKERKKGVTSYPEASALQKPQCILETGYSYLTDPGASLCSGSLPVCLSAVKKRQKKWDKGFVITSLWSQVPFVKEIIRNNRVWEDKAACKVIAGPAETFGWSSECLIISKSGWHVVGRWRMLGCASTDWCIV